MENDDGFIQVPYKHALRRKKQTCDANPADVSVRACEAEKEKHQPETLIIFTTARGVFTSISESRGGVGSLTLFLPLSFPSDPLRAGTPSSLPGVGGLGGGWYSPDTQPSTSRSVSCCYVSI